jgi:antibiotic biosynthesis monooxygenase (ABM) superfamily enzyme
MQGPTETDTGPVTVCVRQHVKRGREREFEAWLAGVGHAAAQFEGHQGLNVLRPSRSASPEYVYIFRFDSYAHLQRWETSPECHAWVQRPGELTEGKGTKQVLTGLEYWFTLPAMPGLPPPPRYKMVLVTLLAIYPLSTLLTTMFSPWLLRLPPLPRGLTVSVALVLLMTYVVMPRLTRLFAHWLYPPAQRAR